MSYTIPLIWSNDSGVEWAATMYTPSCCPVLIFVESEIGMDPRRCCTLFTEDVPHHEDVSRMPLLWSPPAGIFPDSMITDE